MMTVELLRDSENETVVMPPQRVFNTLLNTESELKWVVMAYLPVTSQIVVIEDTDNPHLRLSFPFGDTERTLTVDSVLIVEALVDEFF